MVESILTSPKTTANKSNCFVVLIVGKGKTLTLVQTPSHHQYVASHGGDPHLLFFYNGSGFFCLGKWYRFVQINCANPFPLAFFINILGSYPDVCYLWRNNHVTKFE